MRVVLLADAPYIHTKRWIDYFVEAGHDCHVVSFRPAEVPGATIHYVAGAEPLGKARYLLHAKKVGRLIRQLRPDVLHAMHLTSYGFLGALSGFRPFVVSVWGTDVLEAPHLTPFHHWLTRHALARADAVTATGLHLATETTRYTPPSTPVTVIPYGADLERFAAVERASDDTVVIGTAARLSVEKGARYLIDTFAVLRQRYGEQVRLRIAGDGPERAAIEAQIERAGLRNAVEILGWLPHADVPAFLNSLDIFALPSTYEGFGVASVEASASGLPVVATNVYGIPDVVVDSRTGLLVPAKDPPAFARALARLVDDPQLRHTLGAEGRRYVSAHYDWQQNTRQMTRLYEQFLGVLPSEVGA